MKVKFTDWKILIKYLWKMELVYQDNYRKLSNEKRKRIRKYLDGLTEELIELRGLNFAKDKQEVSK